MGVKESVIMEESCCITEDLLKSALPAKYKNNALHVFDTIDSTNTYAKTLAADGASHGTVIMAQQQTGGKGRLGRSFYSPKEGIYLSLIIKPKFDVTKSVLATSAAAVAVCAAIEEVCGEVAGIKWVNDIYLNGLKVCGILCEGIMDYETGQIDSIIMGIGINTTTEGFPPELEGIAGAVSGDYSRVDLTASVISKILDLMDSIEDCEFIKSYREHSLVIGKTVNVFKGAYRINPDDELPSRPARVLDIDENGGLVVLYSDGSRETLISGEISIRL